MLGFTASLLAAILVYPSAAVIPQQLLRISLVFPTAAAAAAAGDLRFRYADGSYAFAPFADPPLRSADGRTLTLIIDPSRQKLGLADHRMHGFVLRANQRVSLLLGRRVLRTWFVRPGRCAPLDPARWRIAAVRSGTRTPLIVHFSGPVDALSAPSIAVATAAMIKARGNAVLSSDQRSWRFLPAAPWAEGVRLALHPRFENPCGDEIRESFEHPVGTGLGAARTTIFIPIRVLARRGSRATSSAMRATAGR